MARFPFTRQHDGMQCGVACMSMICRHYDKTFSISRLEKSCHVTKEGVSLKAIRDLCEEIGLDSAAGKVTVANLADTPLPCVLHWNQNHFVVLYKTDRNGSRFWIADPGKGKYKCSIEDMERHWVSTQSQGKEKGIAMFFEPTEKFSKNSCNPKGESRSSPLGHSDNRIDIRAFYCHVALHRVSIRQRRIHTTSHFHQLVNDSP